MIIGLLDPALFLPRVDNEVKKDLDAVLESCRRFSVQLIPFQEYWPDLWLQLGLPLNQGSSPSVKSALSELQKLGRASQNHQIAPLQVAAGDVWKNGFEELFAPIGASWPQKMAGAALRAVNTGHEVILFTRRMVGRNLTLHSAGDTTLDEITRWVLHVQPKNIGARQILCVHHPRNITARWTARYDLRLASHADGARFPFCIPANWWKGSTVAHSTIRSKPCWIDQHGMGWARPNINSGAGYHWDVFLQVPAIATAIGLGELNIVEFGAPSSQGIPGDVHHVPQNKRHLFKNVPWKCP
jgi:hypothetical protein